MPTIGHKHLKLIEREKGEDTYKVHCMEKKIHTNTIFY